MFLTGVIAADWIVYETKPNMETSTSRSQEPPASPQTSGHAGIFCWISSTCPDLLVVLDEPGDDRTNQTLISGSELRVEPAAGASFTRRCFHLSSISKTGEEAMVSHGSTAFSPINNY